MKTYLITSNKYTAKICPINIHFLNKNWPGLDVTIVGYEEVLNLKNLPENVKTVSVGNQEDFGSWWTNALIPFFEEVKEDYFTIILDDHILMNEVDKSKMAVIEKQFELGKVDKAMIGGGIPLSATSEYTKNLLVFEQGASYRASLHPAIWTKNYFLKYLKPDMTSWDFEIKNNNSARFDGARIINYDYSFPDEPHLYSYLELYTKGEITINEDGKILTHQPSSRYFDTQDIKHIWNEVQR